MEVMKFMNKRIEWIDPDASIYDAIEKLVDRHIRSLVVQPKPPAKQPGVITARDIVYKVLGEGKNPRDVKVKDVAQFPIICINKETNVIDAIKLMKNKNVARVFVCDGSEIIGVVALMDVMHASLVERARAGNNVQKAIS